MINITFLYRVKYRNEKQYRLDQWPTLGRERGGWLKKLSLHVLVVVFDRNIYRKKECTTRASPRNMNPNNG